MDYLNNPDRSASDLHLCGLTHLTESLPALSTVELATSNEDTTPSIQLHKVTLNFIAEWSHPGAPQRDAPLYSALRTVYELDSSVTDQQLAALVELCNRLDDIAIIRWWRMPTSVYPNAVTWTCFHGRLFQRNQGQWFSHQAHGGSKHVASLPRAIMSLIMMPLPN